MIELEPEIEMLSLASLDGPLGDAEILLSEIIEGLGEGDFGSPIEAIRQAAIALIEGFIDILLELQDPPKDDDQLAGLDTALAENASGSHQWSYPVR